MKTMIIDREISDELIALQEDTASYFCDENYMIGGELYWTLVQSIATAKLAEFRGSLESVT